ncbi:hypothetical protein S40285_04656 [Stachybotrys chlorohalonatus IBT 40285]|uniref:Zn(2)-C6 fungal-type domain-containing protein n=1 Tax=Stachybotrys chlorohalonatus (strain IBT 40285) TaxID=1283841 RepID=A0A084QPH0_STAC4|nr:hypothetical protein S40285_04656 [Stachybotrys chlorohalonata IBT 40285]
MSADLRQACDRCHNKKLRCPKPAGSLSCARCAKAGAPCLFSPPSRPLRRVDAAAAPVAVPLFGWESGFDVGFEANFYGHGDDAPGPGLPGTATPSQGNSTGGSENTATDDATTTSLTAQLADVLLALDRVWRQLSAGCGMQHVSSEQALYYAELLGTKAGVQANIEIILRHTQLLVELYPNAVRLALPKEPPVASDACTVVGCIHPEIDVFQEHLSTQVDHALLNLLFSCHLRVLDLLDCLLRYAHLCTQLVPPLVAKGYDPPVAIPEVRIGSFVALKDTAGSVVLSILTELHTMLVARVEDLSGRLSAVNGGRSGELKVLKIQCDIMGTRTQATFAELAQIKDKMVHLGAMR